MISAAMCVQRGRWKRPIADTARLAADYINHARLATLGVSAETAFPRLVAFILGEAGGPRRSGNVEMPFVR
jgi:hypothetical protein